MKIVLDYDGTLTAEEEQVEELAEKSIRTLSRDILEAPLSQVREDYWRTRARIMAEPHKYWWEVNGLIAAYGDEGAFIANTTTIQVMLRTDASYSEAVARHFSEPEYDPIMDCSNYLFHEHTFDLEPRFRPFAEDVLEELTATLGWEPLVLSSSKGDKVRKNLTTLGFGKMRILGDTRQYEMVPSWAKEFVDPQQGPGQVFRVDDQHTIDLRRPAYYQTLRKEMEDSSRLMVVADTWSMPGALPMMMGIPFLLLKTSYTPGWCERYVTAHPGGGMLNDLALLPERIRGLA
jgi:hypothetical protein